MHGVDPLMAHGCIAPWSALISGGGPSRRVGALRVALVANHAIFSGPVGSTPGPRIGLDGYFDASPCCKREHHEAAAQNDGQDQGGAGGFDDHGQKSDRHDWRRMQIE